MLSRNKDPSNKSTRMHVVLIELCLASDIQFVEVRHCSEDLCSIKTSTAKSSTSHLQPNTAVPQYNYNLQINVSTQCKEAQQELHNIYHEEDDDGADQHPRSASIVVPHVAMNLVCFAWSL